MSSLQPVLAPHIEVVDDGLPVITGGFAGQGV
jgi:hypothetical protein